MGTPPFITRQIPKPPDVIALPIETPRAKQRRSNCYGRPTQLDPCPQRGSRSPSQSATVGQNCPALPGAKLECGRTTVNDEGKRDWENGMVEAT